MFKGIYIILILVSGLSSAQTEQEASKASTSASNNREYRDYSKQDFKVNLELLRAGAHDDSNVNDYYFTAKLYGLLNSSEEIKKKLADQTKVEQDLGQFGTLQVNSLQFWRTDPKEGETVELSVAGETIRELVASTMKKHKLSEDQVAVRMDIELWEVGKSFMFFGEDTKIADTHFYPIPQTKFDTPPRTNQKLEMTDSHGVLVKFAVIYNTPITNKTKD